LNPIRELDLSSDGVITTCVMLSYVITAR